MKTEIALRNEPTNYVGPILFGKFPLDFKYRCETCLVYIYKILQDTCMCQDMDLVQTFDYSQISDTSVGPCTHPGVSCEEGKEREITE